MKFVLAIVIMFAAIGISAAQDFEVNRQPGEPYNLSGMNSDIFSSPFFAMEDWSFSDINFMLTPSQSAFLNVKADTAFPEGYTPKKHAYVGSSVSDLMRNSSPD